MMTADVEPHVADGRVGPGRTASVSVPTEAVGVADGLAEFNPASRRSRRRRRRRGVECLPNWASQRTN